MALDIDRRLHFRSQFELHPITGMGAKWRDISMTILQWINHRTRNASAWDWFIGTGRWTSPRRQRLFVESRHCVGCGSADEPEFWAVRFEHPDNSVMPRQWRTDIGLARLTGGGLAFSLSTTCWLVPGYIGQEPEPPLPSAPNIILKLMSLRNWQSWAGTEALSSVPKLVEEGKGNLFCARLTDRDRRVPIVMVSKDFHTGKPLLDSSRLSRLLMGTTAVYESESSLVDKELEYLLDQEYRCWNGRVRVYQPDLAFEKPGDYRRHRYFVAEDILSLGAKAIEDVLVRGISRRSYGRTDNTISGLEDIDSALQTQRFIDLREGARSSDELASLLEDENKRIDNSLLGIRREEQFWRGEAERLRGLEDEIALKNFRVEFMTSEVKKARSAVTALAAQSSFLENLTEFPSSVLDVVQLAENAYRGRLAFADKAKESAKKATIRDLNAVWKALKAMATVLYDLHFSDELPLAQIAQEFRLKTGIELAAGESQTTKKNKHAASLRNITYEGESFDMLPHVKLGNKPGHLLRIHYGLSKGSRLLIIGHCGDHLPTSKAF